MNKRQRKKKFSIRGKNFGLHKGYFTGSAGDPLPITFIRFEDLMKEMGFSVSPTKVEVYPECVKFEGPGYVGRACQR